MAVPIGLECVAYRNTATYASPTWNPVANIKDLKISTTKGEADVSTRGSGGWSAMRATLKSASIDFSMVFDPSDASGLADFEAVRDAYLTNVTVEFALLDAAITVVGAQGLRASMDVFKMDRNEALTDAVIYDFTMKPTHSANAPAWVESNGTLVANVP